MERVGIQNWLLQAQVKDSELQGGQAPRLGKLTGNMLVLLHNSHCEV